MARPSKPVDVLRAEGKSHRTKQELADREERERSVLSGDPLTERQEVKKNKIAHKEFRRISKLLESIKKSDALYSSGINTYCMLYAEIRELYDDLTVISEIAEEAKAAFREAREAGTVTADDVISFSIHIRKLINQKTALMSAIDRKRNIMLSIDKENIMTISAALRSIPKTSEKQTNPIADILSELNEETKNDLQRDP